MTTSRPGTWTNEFGRFRYRHIDTCYFFGMDYRLVVPGQSAFVASPEKALLDLVYFRKQGDSDEFLVSLRLQNLEQLDRKRLLALAARFGKPKLLRAANRIVELAEQEAAEFTTL